MTPVEAFVVVEAFAVVVDTCGALVVVEDDVRLTTTYEVTFFVI